MDKKELDALKLAYRNAEVPKEGVENMKKLIAKEKKKNVTHLRTWVASAAAALALLVTLPNVSMAAADTLGSLPVVGGLFRVVTFRAWEREEEDLSVRVELPRVLSDTWPQVAREINEEVAEMADDAVEWADEAQGPTALDVRSDIVADTENWFSLRVTVFRAQGGGAQENRIFTVQKSTGRLMELEDVLTQEGIGKAEDEVRAQMLKNGGYFVEEFRELSDEQDFYVTAEGDLVLAFDEYEVAPGFMGAPEFTVSGTLLEGCLAEGIKLR